MSTDAERAAHKAATALYHAGRGPKPPPRDPHRPGKHRARSEAPAPGGPTSDPPRLVAVASDIHWNSEAPSWRAFRRWHRAVRPHHTILLGDLIDAAMVSNHQPHKDDPIAIVDELDALVRECNALLTECGELTLCIGNHDRRVEAYLRGPKPQVTKGLRGITLPELARAHGLDPRAKWFEETAAEPWLPVAQFGLQHGHKSAGSFGVGQYPAAASIARSNGHSVIRGHNHRAQMHCHTAFGRTAIGIANPCMVRPMNYSPNANWQCGWTVLLLRPPTFDWATPYVVICDDDGGACWGDRYYSGRP